MSTAGRQDALLNVRVLDQDVVNDVAQQLQTLIDHAAAAARSLDERIAASQALGQNAATATDGLEQRLELGLRLLKQLEKKAENVAPVLTELDRRAADSEQASGALAGQLEQFGGEVGEVMDRMDAERSRVDQIVTRLEEHSAQSQAALDRAIQNLELRHQDSEAARRQIDQQVVQLHAQAHAATEDLEARRHAASEASDVLRDMLVNLQHQVESVMGRVQKQHNVVQADCAAVDAKVAGVHSMVDNAVRQLDERGESARSASVSLDENLERIETRLDEATLAIDRGTGQFQSQFNAAVMCLDTNKRQIEKSSESLDERVARIGSQVETLADEVARQQGAVSKIEGRAESASDAVELRVTSALKGLNERERALTTLDEKTQTRCDEVMTAVNATVRDVDERVGPVVRGLDERIDTFNARLDGAVEALGNRVDDSGRRTQGQIDSSIRQLQSLRDDAESSMSSLLTHVDRIQQ